MQYYRRFLVAAHDILCRPFLLGVWLFFTLFGTDNFVLESFYYVPLCAKTYATIIYCIELVKNWLTFPPQVLRFVAVLTLP